MRSATLILLLVLAERAFAAVSGGALSDLTYPEFDAEGRLIRQIRAETVSGPSANPVLTHGVVEFYRFSENGSSVVATLAFDEATYDANGRTLEGLEHVAYRSEKGVISARGFFYELNSLRLVLRSEVRAEAPNGELTSDAGVVQLRRDPATGETDVEWANFAGNVVVRGAAVEEKGYKRVETNAATYYGSDESIRAQDVIGYPKVGTKPSKAGSFIVRVGKGLPGTGESAADEPSAKTSEP